MSQLDTLLSIIENPTRRRILQELVREPHYPLQLSRELRVSQQAIMKHLKVLESHDLVRCYLEESDLGGPSRKIYVPTMKFTLIVDVGPGLFNAQLFDMDKLKSAGAATHKQDEEEDSKKFTERIMELRNVIAGVNQELLDLQERRAELIKFKEHTLLQAKQLVEESLEEYQIRRVLYEYIHNPDLSIRQLARALSLRDEVVSQTLKKINEEES
jgi:ArsR family transcriptional regulator